MLWGTDPALTGSRTCSGGYGAGIRKKNGGAVLVESEVSRGGSPLTVAIRQESVTNLRRSGGATNFDTTGSVPAVLRPRGEDRSGGDAWVGMVRRLEHC